MARLPDAKDVVAGSDDDCSDVAGSDDWSDGLALSCAASSASTGLDLEVVRSGASNKMPRESAAV